MGNFYKCEYLNLKKFAIEAEDQKAARRKAPKNLKEILKFTIKVKSLFLRRNLVKREDLVKKENFG